jgi:tRNA-specific adenosine deaminase 3
MSFSPPPPRFTRRHLLDSPDLSHLKRVKKCSLALARILICAASPPKPVDLASLLAADEDLSALELRPILAQVPTEPAQTKEQHVEWSKVWPISYVPPRVGARAEVLDVAKGIWPKTRLLWVESEAKKVIEAARVAKEAGEVGPPHLVVANSLLPRYRSAHLEIAHPQFPIACTVTGLIDPDSLSEPPIVLASAHDARRSTENPLAHAVLRAIDAVALLDRSGNRTLSTTNYLLTGLSVFVSHEPCLMCSMALVHSRVQTVYFLKRREGSGGCGTTYSLHEDKGLNHRFEVWRRKEVAGELEIEDVSVDV